jgi:methylenetetrahydrofolate reductase (NADPH)
MDGQARKSVGVPDIGCAAARLAGEASLEINSLDFAHFAAAREQLRAGQKIFVSHLPGQTWKSSLQVCVSLCAAGFDPVPHIPVRLLHDFQQLDHLLASARAAGVQEPLLISGDYPAAKGAYCSVLQVLQSGALQARGFTRVSLAGHPEGHPRVPWDVICQAQVDKWRAATAAGLDVTFVTQFFFAPDPFVHWARHLRSAGIEARLVAGVAGPTGLSRLIQLARRCGVGASLRSLTSRPAAAVKLLADHDADDLLMDLAAVRLGQPGLFDGLHVFSLGGFKGTVAWLRRFQGRNAG